MIKDVGDTSGSASSLQAEALDTSVENAAGGFIGIAIQLSLLLNVLIIVLGMGFAPGDIMGAAPALGTCSLGAILAMVPHRRGNWRLAGRIFAVGLFLGVTEYTFFVLGPHPLAALSYFNVIMVTGFALGAVDAAVGSVVIIATLATAQLLRGFGIGSVPLAPADTTAIQLGLIFSVAFGSSVLAMGLLHQRRILLRIQESRRLTQRALAALAAEEEARQRGADWAEALARLGHDLVDIDTEERRPERLAAEGIRQALPGWVVMVAGTAPGADRQLALGDGGHPTGPLSERLDAHLEGRTSGLLTAPLREDLARWLDSSPLAWGYYASGPDTEGASAQVVVATLEAPSLEPNPAAMLETAAGMVAAALKRRKREENVRRLSRMDALGQAAGGIAHDFRNVLTTIVGQTELLDQAAGEEGESKARLQTIRTASERGRMLSSKLLSFSSREPGPLVAVDLEKVAQEIQPLLSAAAGGDFTVALSIQAGLGAVRLEEGDLEQILLNLVLNARDAEPRDGRIEVAMRRSTSRADGPKDEAWTELVVRDQGRGMSPAVKMRALEPFFSTKDPGLGTGLGLAVVYGIIRRASGTLEIQSVPQSGTQIIVKLPSTETEKAAETEAPYSEKPTRTARLLLVEDEPTVRNTLAELLRSEGFDVLTAEDGVRAMAIVNKESVIDVVVTDLTMPGLDGYGLSQQLAATGRRIPVVLMSGYAGHQTISPDHLSLVVQQLAKPLHPRELRDAVINALSSKKAAR